jgi:hypothetical protein
MAAQATSKIRSATDSDLASLTGLYNVDNGVSAVLRVPVSEALDKYTILVLKRDALAALLKDADDDHKGPLKLKLASIKKQLAICERVYKQVKALLRPANKKAIRQEFTKHFAELEDANKRLWKREEQYLALYKSYIDKVGLAEGEENELLYLAIDIKAWNLDRSAAKYAIDALLDGNGLTETKVFKASN